MPLKNFSEYIEARNPIIGVIIASRGEMQSSITFIRTFQLQGFLSTDIKAEQSRNKTLTKII